MCGYMDHVCETSGDLSVKLPGGIRDEQAFHLRRSRRDIKILGESAVGVARVDIFGITVTCPMARCRRADDLSNPGQITRCQTRQNKKEKSNKRPLGGVSQTDKPERRRVQPFGPFLAGAGLVLQFSSKASMVPGLPWDDPCRTRGLAQEP